METILELLYPYQSVTRIFTNDVLKVEFYFLSRTRSTKNQITQIGTLKTWKIRLLIRNAGKAMIAVEVKIKASSLFCSNFQFADVYRIRKFCGDFTLRFLTKINLILTSIYQMHYVRIQFLCNS